MPKIICPNKNTDIYKTIYKELGEVKTYEIFMKIDSDRFNKWYGKGEKDSFGYPKLVNGIEFINGVGEKISIYEFNNPQSFEISEANRKSRERISDEAKKYKDIISKMKDVLTTKIAIYREKGEKRKYDKDGRLIKSPYIEKIEELLNDLSIMEDKSAVVEFVDNAIKEIEVAHQRMKELLNKEEHEPKDFTLLKNYINAYDILDETRRILKSDKEVDNTYIANLDNAIAIRNDIKSTYLEEIKKTNAKELAKFSYNLSEEQILDFFETAPFDSSFAALWTDYAGDSKDNILGLLAKLVNEQQSKTREEHILLTHELNKKVDKLEKVKNTTNPLELYNEILEKHDGEETGHYVSKYNEGGFQKEKDRFFKEINESDATEKEKNKLISKWFRENTFEKRPSKKWLSNQFNKLEEDRKNGTNKEIVDFYDFFVEKYKEMQDKIPEYYNLGTRLPSIRKETIDRMIEGNLKDVGSILKNSISDGFVRKEGDNLYGQIINESGEKVNRVPVFFTGKIPVKEMSLDVSHLLRSFSAMAINYDNMNQILDTLESSKEILKERKVTVVSSTGREIINRVKGLEKPLVTTKGELSNTLKQFEKFMEVQVYGQTNDDLGYINLGIVKLDTNKTINSINYYTSMNLLGLNFLNDFANKTQGETMNWAEAFADGLYNKEGYLKAVGVYNKELPRILRDIGERTPESKVNILGEWFDVFNDYRGSINENQNRSKYKKLLKLSSAFFAMKCAEHSISSKVMIAALYKIKPLHNGNVINGLDNMWDAIKVHDGHFTIDSRVTNFNELEQRQFGRKCQTILRRTHGNYNTQTAAAWQKNGILRMVGALRKWIRPGYLRRFESRRENQFLEDTTEGNYRTTVKFLAQLTKDLRQMQVDILKEDWNNLEDFEKQNIKRTIVEVSAILLTMAVITAFSGLKDDDDDYGKKAKLLLSYQANRLQSELMFYSDPRDAFKLLKSPAASMSTISALTDFMSQLIMNPTEVYKKRGLRYEKGELKLQRKAEQLFPLYKQFTKLSNNGLQSQINWFNGTAFSFGKLGN